MSLNKKLTQIFVLFILFFSIFGLITALPNSARAQGSVNIVLNPQNSVVEVGNTFSVVGSLGC